MAKKLTEEEKKNNQDFLDLCLYIEKEILHYEPNQKLQKKAALRLRGLSKGQVVANNQCQQYGEYPYEVILLTFKANKTKIINAIKGKDFDSEERAIGYISAIIRDQLNDMYTRYIKAKKSKEKTETVDTSMIEQDDKDFEYNPVTNTTNNDKFKELW